MGARKKGKGGNSEGILYAVTTGYGGFYKGPGPQEDWISGAEAGSPDLPVHVQGRASAASAGKVISGYGRLGTRG